MEVDPKFLNDKEIEQCNLYQRLIGMEKNMNHRVETKLREYDASLRASHKTVKRALKLQTWFKYTESGGWNLRVDGKVEANVKVALSSCFKKLVVQLNPNLYTGGHHHIEWNCFQAKSESDGFELSRQNMNIDQRVNVYLVRNSNPERYVMSKDLFELVGPYLEPSNSSDMNHGKLEETRQNVVMALWQYIKHNELTQKSDCRLVNCDEKLRKILHCQTVKFSTILQHLKMHLEPVKPILIELTLRFNQPPDTDILLDERCYDIEIPETQGVQRIHTQYLEKIQAIRKEDQAQTALLDDQTNSIISRINQEIYEREWLLQFTRDPCHFIQDVIESQRQDLRILSPSHAESSTHTGDAFHDAWVQDAISDLWKARTDHSAKT